MNKQVSKEELEKIYMENTNEQAAEILGISTVTLNKMIKRADIELKGKGYPNNYEIV